MEWVKLMFGHFVIYISIIVAKTQVFGNIFLAKSQPGFKRASVVFKFFIIVFKGSLILKELSLTHCFIKGLIPDLFLRVLK